MRPVVVVLSVVLVLSSSLPTFGQQTAPQTTASPQRDPRAGNVLKSALLALGGSVPASSTANGTVEITAGEAMENVGCVYL